MLCTGCRACQVGEGVLSNLTHIVSRKITRNFRCNHVGGYNWCCEFRWSSVTWVSHFTALGHLYSYCIKMHLRESTGRWGINGNCLLEPTSCLLSCPAQVIEGSCESVFCPRPLLQKSRARHKCSLFIYWNGSVCHLKIPGSEYK